MITTKNRAGDLRRTCRVLRRLDPPPLEVLITADGCIDDTVEVASRELPGVRLFVNEVGQGSVVSRDRMIREARGDLVLALDDDSYPEQLDCIARFVPIFENRPQLAVLHFPQRTDEYPGNACANRLRPGTFDAFVCQFWSGHSTLGLSPTTGI